MPQPIRISSPEIDLSARFQTYTTVDASPSAGTETVIATLALANFGDIAVLAGIRLEGWAAFTVGTSGVSANLRIRQTDVNGTVVAASGATTVAATNLKALTVEGYDLAPGIHQYALTLTIGSGAAASTVSALRLAATIV